MNDGFQTTAQYISLDDYSGTHYWVQTGWSVGTLPDNTFTAQPVFYAESNLASYVFRNLGPETWGTSHLFQIWITASDLTWHIAVDNVEKYNVSGLVGASDIQYGNIAGALEDHEAQNIPINRADNGHWTNLKFYWSGTWRDWGASDPNYPFPIYPVPLMTSGHVSEQCQFFIPNAISNTEFVIAEFLHCGGSGFPGKLDAPPEYGPGGNTPHLQPYQTREQTTTLSLIVLGVSAPILVLVSWKTARWWNRKKRVQRLPRTHKRWD